jgi:hypothetical protein
MDWIAIIKEVASHIGDKLDAISNKQSIGVELKGVEMVTIKGEKGDKGDPGENVPVPGPQGDAGRDGKDGVNGVDGRNGKDGKDGINGLPGRAGKDGSPDTGEETVAKINKDKSGTVIKKEHIEGLAEIESLAKVAQATKRTFGAAGNFIYVSDLSSQTNGVLKTFTVPAHSRGIMVMGSDFPSILFNGNGYSEPTATTITLTTENAPSTGSQLGYMYVLI